MPKFDFSLRSPLMNAAGSLGFAPDPRRGIDLSRLGAFITSPISLRPRRPARILHYLPFPGGFLLHTGYPNPGLKAAIRRYAGQWARSQAPVWVHIIPGSAEETVEMVQRLEQVEGVMGVEIGIQPETEPAQAVRIARAAAGELPAILRLPFERLGELAGSLAESGAAAFSLAPPRGLLPDLHGDLSQGRLYGPALLPLALAAVRSLVKAGLPVIGAGGVYRPLDVQAMLSAGAIAVQLDTVLWRGVFPL